MIHSYTSYGMKELSNKLCIYECCIFIAQSKCGLQFHLENVIKIHTIDVILFTNTKILK